MAGTLAKRLLGDPKIKRLKELRKRVGAINDLADTYENKKIADLKKDIDGYKEQVEAGKVTLDDILPDIFALTRAASMKTVDMRHFDVQLIGGMALHEGNVAEMRTGEGKTLVATLPVVLNALTGKGVHVVTVNDYLAQRDAGWMAQIYSALGLSTAVIIADKSFIYDPEYNNDEHDDERFKRLKPCSRREAYAADVTYGTNNEFGFDYLRDNMVRDAVSLRQRPLNYAIIDEVDSILVDEARTPLIISAPASVSGNLYSKFSGVARILSEDDYELDEKRRTVNINDEGIEKVEEKLGIENIYGPDNVREIYHLDQALRAETLFKKDKDYVVTDEGEVVIVDEFTGRLMHGRRYNEGLHQAIEAKEGVEVQQESMTLATISFQNYFRLYEKLSGMTGTAETEEEEFQQIYDLDVIVIPTNKDIARVDHPDRIYKTEAGKLSAVVEEVKMINETGQPILLGSASVDKNELLSKALTKAGVTHEILNAKNHEREAAIVAKAGEQKAITLATNIAGRGTDIVLGEGVKELGGLYVLGSERHESRRIDNQLRGRCGRQGDPGQTRFFISAEDELMRIFGGERLASLMDRMGVDDDVAIENKAVGKAIENAQKKVESSHFDQRKNVVQYDDVMNRHRKAIYQLRQDLLAKEDVKQDYEEMIVSEAQLFMPETAEDRDERVKEAVRTFHLTKPQAKKLEEATLEEFTEKLQDIALKSYKSKEKEFTPELLRRVERDVYLQVLDTLWMQHLEGMSHLREGIRWRSVGQKDPLVEYRREGQKMFEEMQQNMANDVVTALFHTHAPASPQELDEPVETELTAAAKQSVANDGSGETTKTRVKLGKDGKVKEEKTTRKAEPVDSKTANKKKREAAKKKKAKRKKGRR